MYNMREIAMKGLESDREMIPINHDTLQLSYDVKFDRQRHCLLCDNSLVPILWPYL